MYQAGKIITAFAVALFLTMPGCRAQNGDPKKEEAKMPASNDKIEMKSDAFQSGELIPQKYTCDGADVSPSLSWGKIPPNTKELILICDDPDAPMGTWVHWVVYGISPETTGLPENAKDTTAGLMQGKSSFGKTGYGGPCPPKGKPHRYFFKLYAVDKTTGLKPGSSKADVMKSIDGHILAQGELMGRYGR